MHKVRFLLGSGMDIVVAPGGLTFKGLSKEYQGIFQTNVARLKFLQGSRYMLKKSRF